MVSLLNLIKLLFSAKHHLTPMDKQLEPYDLTLKNMKKDEKTKWGETVISQMKEKGIDPQKRYFYIFSRK